MTTTDLNSKGLWDPSMETILGFFDADGSFHITITYNVKNHISFRLTVDRFLGLHIGDGSFWISNQFTQNGYYAAKFYWSLSDCVENELLLKTVKQYLLDLGITTATIDKSCRLRISGIENCQKLVAIWKNSSFPTERKHQYKCFCEALTLYKRKDFRKDFNLMKRFIYLTWTINPATAFKKSGSLKKDLQKLRQTNYFDIELI